MSVSSVSSARRYSIVEPHPSVPSTHYFSTGRGGAGNVTKAPSTTTRGSDATGPASCTSLTTAPSSSAQRKTFTAGRGGAGNVHPASERAIFSFDEELERQLSQDRHAAPVYHVGRGGAGNVGLNAHRDSRPVHVDLDGSLRRRSEDSAASSRSSGSESGADQFNRSVKKGWKKVWGGGNYMTG